MLGLGATGAAALAQESATEAAADKLRAAHLKSVGSRAHKSFYPNDKWDLSSLPAYRPKPGLSGVIRIGGKYLTTGTVLSQWQKAFTALYPDVRFEVTDQDLESGLADIIQKRGYTWSELHAFQAKFGYYPLEIEMATGSYNVPGWTPAFAIFVNNDNPIRGLTIDQLDGMFGGPRRGGWKGTVWNPAAARGRDQNIRTWGQVGLTGAWKDREVVPSGRPLKYHIQLYFERKVFEGGSIWNENLQEFAHELQPDGTRALSSVSIVKSVQENLGGIAFADLASDMEGVKYIPIAREAGQPFVPLTLDTLRSREYPLFLEVFLYANRDPAKPMNPLVQEFLRFALSREGQQAIQNDGKWLPLTETVAAEQRRKLD
ncbi:PstS family phosphate ABC transporter substrate-binding protein [Sphingomonas gilva]|nr:substrate-binding domain-containing protein [Sphingomonas gilva]